ncbi:hypothetical protein PG994_008643 [Apiospora phragmitis]|uniref:Uncharacterized protein n=1 Tax=Apiospora phragmitis TaxID=2905665 RepID=A0ABR1UH09_9PEZI
MMRSRVDRWAICDRVVARQLVIHLQFLYLLFPFDDTEPPKAAAEDRALDAVPHVVELGPVAGDETERDCGRPVQQRHGALQDEDGHDITKNPDDGDGVHGRDQHQAEQERRDGAGPVASPVAVAHPELEDGPAGRREDGHGEDDPTDDEVLGDGVHVGEDEIE